MSGGEASSGNASLAETYERLREGNLECATRGGHFGLAILVREGVAAWIANGVGRSANVSLGGTTERTSTWPTVANESRAKLVAVLANLAMANPVEQCR